jgi:hypothetical protein
MIHFVDSSIYIDAHTEYPLPWPARNVCRSSFVGRFIRDFCRSLSAKSFLLLLPVGPEMWCGTLRHFFFQADVVSAVKDSTRYCSKSIFRFFFFNDKFIHIPSCCQVVVVSYSPKNTNHPLVSRRSPSWKKNTWQLCVPLLMRIGLLDPI